jgi:amphiphysin
MFNAGVEFTDHFIALFSPVTGEFDLARQYPDSAATFENMGSYQELMAELNAAVQPELELIQSRIVGPLKEFKEVVKAVRKSITKREHKVNSLSLILPPASVPRQRNLTTFIS